MIGYNIYNIDGGQIEKKALKISSVIWLILFILLAIFIMMRHVDGAGVVQTMPIKLINLAVLAVFALIVLALKALVKIASAFKTFALTFPNSSIKNV